MNPESAIQRLGEPLYRAKGWIKFAGVLLIINGVVSIFSLWGILVCWIPIWMGALLCGASNRIRAAVEADDEAAYLAGMEKMGTYFRITGVLTIVGLALAVLAIFAAILIPAVVRARQMALGQ